MFWPKTKLFFLVSQLVFFLLLYFILPPFAFISLFYSPFYFLFSPSSFFFDILPFFSSPAHIFCLKWHRLIFPSHSSGVGEWVFPIYRSLQDDVDRLFCGCFLCGVLCIGPQTKYIDSPPSPSFENDSFFSLFRDMAIFTFMHFFPFIFTLFTCILSCYITFIFLLSFLFVPFSPISFFFVPFSSYSHRRNGLIVHPGPL